MEKSKASSNPMPSLADALTLHQQGRLGEADAAYRIALDLDPAQPDAHHLLGVLALQDGRPADAVGLIQAAIAITPDRAQFHFNLGSALGQSGRPLDAIAAYDRALTLQPDDPDTLTSKATALLALNRLPDALTTLDEAIRLRPTHGDTIVRAASVALALGDFSAALDRFAQALEQHPNSAPAHAGRALALAAMDRPAEALPCFDRSLQLNHADPTTHANRALTLSRLGRPTEALAAFDTALSQNPRHVHALDNRGTVLHALGQHQQALASHDAALALDPNFPPAHNNRGATLQALHRHAEALAAHDKALALTANDPQIHNNRATALQALDRYPDAMAAYNRAITLRPGYADALGNRAVLLQMTGRPTEAMASFNAALAIRPLDANLRFNASLCRLLLGDLDAGWRDFEHRWDNALMAAERRDFGRPRWQGETTGTVLLHAEQGFGDTLQFCRYAPLVADLGVRVVLEVQPALLRLMRRLDPRLTVIARGEPLPPFDRHCPLMSLPLTLNGTAPSAPTVMVGAGPPSTPSRHLHPSPNFYLRADPNMTARWRDRIAAIPGRNIGLVWAGSPRQHAPELRAADRRRSIQLQQFAPLAAVPDVTFISLQKGQAADQPRPPGMNLLDFTAELTDFDDTAALIAALDLVISVDTAVVHLAGALGVPVWVLNRFDTCWRWLLGRTDSPWYRSVTLFRQPALGDWDSVMQQVAAALGGTSGQAV
jgi:tetratricopeptide (TPR) repeat protein